MRTFQRKRLSTEEAEAYLAGVWRLLEEFEVPSPRLHVAEQEDGLIDLSLEFDDDAEALGATPAGFAPHLSGSVQVTARHNHRCGLLLVETQYAKLKG